MKVDFAYVKKDMISEIHSRLLGPLSVRYGGTTVRVLMTEASEIVTKSTSHGRLKAIDCHLRSKVMFINTLYPIGLELEGYQAP